MVAENDDTIDITDMTALTTSGKARYDSNIFQGVIVDTGASMASTGGIDQLIAYQNNIDASATLDTSTAGSISIKFGVGNSKPSVGSLTIRTPIGSIQFHIINTATPFLCSLKDLDRLRVYYNNLKDEIVTPQGAVKVARKYGHAFLLWGNMLKEYIIESLTNYTCHLTDVDIMRLHRRFGHPSVERFHALLERSGHEFEKKALEKLTKLCHQCQVHGKSPGRFKFKVPVDSDFNSTIYVDIFYIDNKPVLHIIDEATRFSAARFLRDISANTTWEALRSCWVDTYLGPPEFIVHDAGTNFTSQEFKQKAYDLAITTKWSPSRLTGASEW